MNDKLVVLLIEDDPSECEAIQKYVESIHDVVLAGVSNNSEKALVLTKAYLPDAVILIWNYIKVGEMGYCISLL